MTPTRLKYALRAEAGLSQRGAAKLLEINERTMRRYISGEQPIPRVVEYAIYWISSHEVRRLRAKAKWSSGGKSA